MKKLVLVLMIMVATVSFGSSKAVQNIDKGELIRLFSYEGFDFDDDGDYLRFKNRSGQYEQRVEVFIYQGSPYNIHMTSSHYHRTPNASKIEKNLEELIILIRRVIPSDDFKKLMAEEYSGIKDKPFRLRESKDGNIRTSYFDTEMGMSLESD